MLDIKKQFPGHNQNAEIQKQQQQQQNLSTYYGVHNLIGGMLE